MWNSFGRPGKVGLVLAALGLVGIAIDSFYISDDLEEKSSVTVMPPLVPCTTIGRIVADLRAYRESPERIHTLENGHRFVLFVEDEGSFRESGRSGRTFTVVAVSDDRDPRDMSARGCIVGTETTWPHALEDETVDFFSPQP